MDGERLFSIEAESPPRKGIPPPESSGDDQPADERRIVAELQRLSMAECVPPLPGLTISPRCGTCPYAPGCRAAESNDACPDVWSASNPGGLNPTHPDHPDAKSRIEEVGGLALGDIRPDAVPLPDLPTVMHHVDRRNLVNEVERRTLVVPARAVVSQSGNVISATEFRKSVGLPDHCRLVLSFFASDRLLVPLWGSRDALIESLKEAGYDYVLPPSLSTWYGRPFLHTRLQIRRSLQLFNDLKLSGIDTAPRVGWAYVGNVEDQAAWCNDNPQVRCVALDLSSVKQPADFAKELRFLELFERLTGRRLVFIIQGPSASWRCRMIFEATNCSRVHLVTGRAIARFGGGFREKARTEQQRIQLGRDQARRRRSTKGNRVPTEAQAGTEHR